MRIVPKIVGALLVSSLAGLVACGPPPAPITPEPPDPQAPVTIDDAPPVAISDGVPRSIRRLAAEQREEIESIITLLRQGDLGDATGRARALRTATDLEHELRGIEQALNDAADDSGRLDEVVERLRRFESRAAIFHDSLVAARE